MTIYIRCFYSAIFMMMLLLTGCGKEAPDTRATESGNLYIDIHKNLDGLTPEAVEAAHKKDLEIQKKYGVKFIKYWYDEDTGTVFCLSEAPSKEAAMAVHREAHGMVADEIVKVKEGE